MKTTSEPSIDLKAFHAGERDVLAQIYRRHLGRVSRTVSRYCRGADAEGVIHDLFLALLESPAMRANFKGGDLGAWLSTVASRRALDYLRKEKRWTLLDDPRSLEGKLDPVDEEEGFLHRDQAAKLAEALDRFAEEVLPDLKPKLRDLFHARFRSPFQSQMQAAAKLGIPRTTLIDREAKLMKDLSRFLRHKLKIEGGRS